MPDQSPARLVTDVALRLVDTLEREGWFGWDPYDGLSSPLAQLLPGRRGRQAWIQLHKRLPVNLRPLVGIRPIRMTKTAALALMSGARSIAVRTRLGSDGLSSLRQVVLDNARGDSTRAWWGYEFPVQTRWTFYPKGAPNVVVTAFAVHALLETEPGLDRPREEQLLAAAGTQLASMSDRSPRGVFFRYVPNAPTLVYNASALAAATLARIGDRSGRIEWVELAYRAGEAIVAAQSPEGGWPYGEAPGLSWQDPFHTAYILLSLNRLRHNGFQGADQALERGTRFLVDVFFTPVGEVRYLRGRPPMADAHSVGTCVQALVDLREFHPGAGHLAEQVLLWAVPRLWLRGAGRFMIRQRRVVRNRITYPRWSDGHMLLGMACYLGLREGRLVRSGPETSAP